MFIRPLSSVLNAAVNKYQRHEKSPWECQESNPRLLGEKLVCYLCAMQPPTLVNIYPGACWELNELLSYSSVRQRGHLAGHLREVGVPLEGPRQSEEIRGLPLLRRPRRLHRLRSSQVSCPCVKHRCMKTNRLWIRFPCAYAFDIMLDNLRFHH